MLEVDLEYTEEFHDLHSDYALAPECKKMGKVNSSFPTYRIKITT